MGLTTAIRWAISKHKKKWERVRSLTIKWTKWTDKVVRSKHGNIERFRKLYEGSHSHLFERAKRLIDQGEITDQIMEGRAVAQNVRSPYIVANVSKMIVDIPATFVSRAVGQFTTTTTIEDFDMTIEGEDDGFIDPLERQKEMLKGIARRSNLAFEHKTNIIHHQMDGGIVGVPFDGEHGIRMEFKARDVYYPHDDGLGVDLAVKFDVEDDEGEIVGTYLHVYRERVGETGLETRHILFERDESGGLTEVEDETEVQEILGLDEVERTFPGRDKPFVVYWANNKTFMNPLGRSELENQEGKQDEINWRLTMNSIVYERNGKPRIAVSKEIFNALSERAYERYGDESKIDHRDLEITTFDANGKSMEVIQIDVTKIGDIQWVKDVMKIMLMETQTSEKAVDFFSDGAGVQSGVAKFYDLFMSIVKAEQIADEYVHFLQQLFENCLWIANQDDKRIIVEEPKIQIRSMMPIARKELIEQESSAFKNGTQSIRTTVENQNPTASDEWITDEIDAIEEGGASTDTTAILQGRQTMNNLLDNRNANGSVQGGEDR